MGMLRLGASVVAAVAGVAWLYGTGKRRPMPD